MLVMLRDHLTFSRTQGAGTAGDEPLYLCEGLQFHKSWSMA